VVHEHADRLRRGVAEALDGLARRRPVAHVEAADLRGAPCGADGLRGGLGARAVHAEMHDDVEAVSPQALRDAGADAAGRAGDEGALHPASASSAVRWNTSSSAVRSTVSRSEEHSLNSSHVKISYAV